MAVTIKAQRTLVGLKAEAERIAAEETARLNRQMNRVTAERLAEALRQPQSADPLPELRPVYAPAR